MKQKYKWLAVSLVLLSSSAHAALSDNFVSNSAAIIKDSCGSGLDYDINRPYDENESGIFGGGADVKNEYREAMSSIINNALVGAQKESNKASEKASGQYSNPTPTGLLDQEIESQSKASPSKNYESNCPSGGSEFANCKVIEQLNAEWCGYNMYLWAKMKQDERLLLKTDAERGGLQNTDIIRLQAERIAEIQAEKDKAEVAAEQTAIFYQSFNSAYDEATADKVSSSLGDDFNQKLLLLRLAISTWHAKFVNAQSKFCKQ